MLFADNKDSSKSVFVDVLLYDSRSTYQLKDLVHVDAQDTGKPIIISHAQNQSNLNPDVIYTSPIFSYGNPLTPAYSGTLKKSATKDYGFCINQSQFSRMLNDINSNSKTTQNLSTDLTNYNLIFALIADVTQSSFFATRQKPTESP